MAKKPGKVEAPDGRTEWMAALGELGGLSVPGWVWAAGVAALVATKACERISYYGMAGVTGVPGVAIAIVVLLLAGWANPPLKGLGAPPDPDEPPIAAWLAFFARLAVGLALVFVPLGGSVWVLDTYDLPKQSTSTVLQAAMLVFWAAARVTGRRAPQPIFFVSAYAAPLFLLAAVLSVPWAINPAVAAMEVGRIAMGVATLLVVHDLARDRGFAWRTLVLATMTALGICWLSTQQALNYEIEGFPQVIAPAACFGNKNMATEYLVLLFPMALGLLLWGRHVAVVAAGMIATMIFEWVLGVSYTRADWLASFVLLGIIFGGYVCQIANSGKSLSTGEVRSLKRTLVGRLLLAVFVLAVGLLPVFGARVIAQTFGKSTSVADALAANTQTTFDASRHSTVWRVTAWVNTLMMVKSNFLFGVGASNWQFLYPLYHSAWRVDEAFDTHTQATTLHNDFLQYWAELGIVGFLAFVALFVALGFCLVAHVQDLPGPWGVIGVMATASAFACGTDALASFPFKLGAPTLIFWVMFAIAHRAAREIGIALEPLPEKKTLVEERDLTYRTPVLLMAATFGGMLLAGWAVSDWKASATLKKAYIMSNEGRWQEASGEFLQAAEDMPYVYNTYLLLGRAYYTIGQLWNGVAANMMATKYHPYHCNIYYNMANCYRDLGRPKEAVEAFLRSAELYPGNVDAWNNAAMMLRMPGPPETEKARTEKAIECYRQAIANKPQHPEAHLQLATMLTNLNRGQEAIEVLHQAISQNKNFYKAYQALGNVYQTQNKLQDAIREYEKAVEIDPGYAEGLNNLAGTYWKLGDGKRAAMLFERVLQLQPGFAPSYFGLADIHFALRRREAALNDYQHFVDLWPAQDQHKAIAQQRIAELKNPSWGQTPTAPVAPQPAIPVAPAPPVVTLPIAPPTTGATLTPATATH